MTKKKEKISTEIPESFFLRDDAYDESYFHFKNQQDDIRELLNEEAFKIKDTGETYRTINHWESEGVINTDRKEGEWRRFSLVELVWIYIISDLREFGFPLEKIKKVNEEIFSDEYGVAQFEFYLAKAVVKSDNSVLVVQPDGKAHLGTVKEFHYSLENHAVKGSFICIYFSEILNKISGNSDHVLLNVGTKLSKKEIKVLNAIRVGKYKEVTIRSKDGQIVHLDKTRDVDDEKLRQAERLFASGDYQDFQAVTEDGRVVHAEITDKEKV